ncbi:MAG TPA: type II toxin-antitoxin system HicA family toxin [Stellaceae bacterium]|nr:type II toxin-antitoxin system HicA family toxin [Stellaceae bacterium]
MGPYTRELRRLLAGAGWRFVRQGKGDHEIWKGPTGKTVAIDTSTTKRHLANAILKQAGLPKAF